MTIPTISIVASAPLGLAGCLYLDDLLKLACESCTEVIIVSANPTDKLPPKYNKIRFITVPHTSAEGLVTAGVRIAGNDWVIVTEDHCLPLSGFLAAYRAAIATHPDIDLFAGAAEALTSNEPWELAVFMCGLADFVPGVKPRRNRVTNANMMIRRSAIMPAELALDGGLQNLTAYRLIAAGRMRKCHDAVVDHVVRLNRSQALSFLTSCTLESIDVAYATHTPVPWYRMLVKRCLAYLDLAALHPLRIIRQLGPTRFGGVGLSVRVTALGCGVAVAACASDIRRFLTHRPHAPHTISS